LIIQGKRMRMKVLTQPLRTSWKMPWFSLETPTLGLMHGGKNASLSFSLKLVNVLWGKVSQRISTFSRKSSMQRSRVNMTIAQLTASLSAHPPLNTSLKDHTGGNSPLVETTAPRTTVELEGNVNGDMAQGLTCSLPKGPEQQDPPPSNLTPRPVPADYPFPCLKLHTPPTNRSAIPEGVYVNWKKWARGNPWTATLPALASVSL